MGWLLAPRLDEMRVVVNPQTSASLLTRRTRLIQTRDASPKDLNFSITRPHYHRYEYNTAVLGLTQRSLRARWVISTATFILYLSE